MIDVQRQVKVGARGQECQEIEEKCSGQGSRSIFQDDLDNWHHAIIVIEARLKGQVKFEVVV